MTRPESKTDALIRLAAFGEGAGTRELAESVLRPEERRELRRIRKQGRIDGFSGGDLA